MLSRLYAKWMYAWETALTTRDTNRIVRPLEWGFDWLEDFSPGRAAHTLSLPKVWTLVTWVPLPKSLRQPGRHDCMTLAT